MPKANNNAEADADRENPTIIEGRELTMEFPVAKAVEYALEHTLQDLNARPREAAINDLRKRIVAAQELLKKAPVVEIELAEPSKWTFFHE